MSTENLKTLPSSTMHKKLLKRIKKKANDHKNQNSWIIYVEQVITLMRKYIYNKGRSRVARKNFGQCRNLWREKKWNYTWSVRISTLPSVSWMKRKKQFPHQFWPSGKCEWFNIYNYISKTYFVRTDVLFLVLSLLGTVASWMNVTGDFIFLLGKLIQCMALALKSSSTGKFRSGSTNVDSWLPLSCALGEAFAAETGETSCVTVSGEAELDEWHSDVANWDGPLTAALEFCRDTKSSC